MRNTTMSFESSLIAIMIVVFLVFILQFKPSQKLLYPVVRSAAEAKVNYQTRNMQVVETEHYIIKYTQPDAEVVQLVASAAEEAYIPVKDALGYVPQDKTLIIIYHDKSEMNNLSGQLGTEGAMGVYWGGVIQVLSPSAWLKDTTNPAVDFINKGPLLHEYTHLVFDHLTNGNYPRWFTEGLAQYMEYKYHNYEWLTPQNKLTGSIYSMKELEKSFDELPNQSLAYRESFAAVRYIAEVYGDEKLRQIALALRAGSSMEKAISSVLNISYSDYMQAWPHWAKEHMTTFKQ